MDFIKKSFHTPIIRHREVNDHSITAGALCGSLALQIGVVGRFADVGNGVFAVFVKKLAKGNALVNNGDGLL